MNVTKGELSIGGLVLIVGAVAAAAVGWYAGAAEKEEMAKAAAIDMQDSYLALCENSQRFEVGGKEYICASTAKLSAHVHKRVASF